MDNQRNESATDRKDVLAAEVSSFFRAQAELPEASR